MSHMHRREPPGMALSGASTAPHASQPPPRPPSPPFHGRGRCICCCSAAASDGRPSFQNRPRTTRGAVILEHAAAARASQMPRPEGAQSMRNREGGSWEATAPVGSVEHRRCRKETLLEKSTEAESHLYALAIYQKTYLLYLLHLLGAGPQARDTSYYSNVLGTRSLPTPPHLFLHTPASGLYNNTISDSASPRRARHPTKNNKHTITNRKAFRVGCCSTLSREARSTHTKHGSSRHTL